MNEESVLEICLKKLLQDLENVYSEKREDENENH
jgi:hypothetical protein